MTAPPAAPGMAAEQRLRYAAGQRPDTDYRFDFWTAFGWTVLTLGVYSVYVLYQLVRRSREHNRRRVELLGAAYETAWERAIAAGRADELRPQFERVAADLAPLDRMSQDFRDPVAWLLLDLVGGGIVWLVALVVLDHDLVRHERHERAVEAGLAEIFAQMGNGVPPPMPATKQPHNYAGRIVATVFSFGLYALWWTADVMREGNRNFADDEVWEDVLIRTCLRDSGQ